MNHISVAPFGARLTVAAAAVQAMADACPRQARTSKWTVLRWVSDARALLGLSDRAVAVLHALLSFVQGDDIKAGEVVFPSNVTLSARAHGMAAPTLRRHIAQLVAAGLIVRRDSPNGKRYARKGEDGGVALAFGFELTPLVARADELSALAARVADDRRRRAEIRERITLLRRDIDSTRECLLNEGVATDLNPIPKGPARSASMADLEDAAFTLGLLKAAMDKQLTDLVKSRNPSGNAVRSERHKQDSNPDICESELLQEKEQAGGVAAENSGGAGGMRREKREEHAGQPRIDLSAVVAACPTLKDWVPRRLTTWSDLQQAAETVRPALGISADAWQEAVDAMGGSGAAVTVATILQRADMISSPGGYLRALSARAREGQFSPAPVVVSLLRQRAKAGMGV